MRPRSGLALKHAITMPNAPGTIDPGYRGELRVILLNLGREPYTDPRRRPHRPDDRGALRSGGVGGRRAWPNRSAAPADSARPAAEESAANSVTGYETPKFKNRIWGFP